MTRVTLIVAAGALALAPVSAGAQAGGRAQVSALVHRETAAIRTADWPALWASYTPLFRRVCSHERWLANVRKTRAAFPERVAPIRLRILSIRLEGPVAVVDYVWRYRLQGVPTVQRVFGDVFVKVDGRWGDELDATTRCTG